MTQVHKWMELFAFFIYFFKSCTFGACLYGFFINTFTPTFLLDTYSVLPVYYILRKIPAYPFIRAYPFIKFDGIVQPTRLLEPTLLLER